ncbi:PIG-L family deacetylase [Candidatus Woesearchaeota archaeon]|nr:PIG-L family deacetylase [Candidatus Woesearchaeota archaeon]
MKKNILIFCAHPDDEVFGVGGSVAKYVNEGYRVKTVVFSYGEQSHPWIKKHFVIETRIKESEEASKVLGSEKPSFLGLREGHFSEDMKRKNAQKFLSGLIKRTCPSKIFTHSFDDPHPDHKLAHKITLDAVKKSGKKCSIYTFDIWNPFNVRKRKNPMLYVDISKTFGTKIKALRCFKSQTASMVSLLWSVYFKAIKQGIESGNRFAEIFYKVK